MSLSGNEKERQSDEKGERPESVRRDLLGAISWELFAPIIVVAMIALGVVIYGLFPQIGYLGAGALSMTIVLGGLFAIGSMISRFIKSRRSKSI